MEAIKRFFSAPVFEGDENKTQRARLLHVILVVQAYIVILAIVGTQFAAVASGENRLPELAMLAGSFLLVMFWRFLMWRGQVSIASAGLIIAFTLGIASLIALNGTIQSVGVIFFPLTIVMAVLLINKRAGIVAFVVVTIIGMLIAQFEVSGLLPAPNTATNLVSVAISLITGMGLALVLLYLAVQSTEDALQRAREKEQEVLLLVSTLEQSVNERTASAEDARTVAESARAEAESARKNLEVQFWLATGQTQLADAMRGELTLSQLAENIISQICQYTGAQAGALFVLNEKTLTLVGRYAYADRPGFDGSFQLGEGLVGQAAADGKVMTLDVIPSDALVISTGLVDMKPRQLAAAPFYMNGKVVGVIELATLSAFGQIHLELWNRISESIGSAFNAVQTRQRLAELLMESQAQAENLKAARAIKARKDEA